MDRMRIWWLVLLIPSVAAGEFAWIAPDDAVAGHPIQASYAIVESTNPLQLEGHVNVDLAILLDGTPLLATSSLHEHDGLHSFTFTPPGPGLLQLQATTAAGTFTQDVAVVPSTPSDRGQATLEGATWQYVPQRSPPAYSAGVDGQGHYSDMTVLLDATDDGRLRFATTSHIHASTNVRIAPEAGVDTLHGYFMGRSNGGDN